MRAWFLALPLFVILIGIGAVAMLLPAFHAFVLRDLHVSRAFFYSGVVFLIVFTMIGIATSGRPVRRQGRSHLISLLATFAVLPLFLAVPFYEAVRDTSFLNAYVEMVSSLTTTGATLFAPERLPSSVHLWRAEVAWLGGFFVWVTAFAILEPLSLGGFEVTSSAEIGQGAVSQPQIAKVAEPSARLLRFAVKFAPIYAGLTLILWIALLISGDTPLVSITHAMSVMATSGISPVGGLENAGSGLRGEAIVLLFLVFALSRLTFSAAERGAGWRSVYRDPELRTGLFLVVVVPAFLFLRHWVGAYEVDEELNVASGARALWGSVFTVLSFLTTTGFESAAWADARSWSGLPTPGMILLGLALFGGGVATTAGGVKLLRVFALYKHGLREMEKLVHPSSIGGAGQVARRFRRQGAYVAWIFFMLFALSIATVMIALSLTGIGFEDAMILTLAALSTTGPLTELAGSEPIALGLLGAPAKLILAAAMVLGRLETLAIIALLNPDFWRG